MSSASLVCDYVTTYYVLLRVLSSFGWSEERLEVVKPGIVDACVSLGWVWESRSLHMALPQLSP